MLAGVLVRITQITEVSCHGLLECIHNTVLLSCHLVAHVNLGEAEGAEMRVGALHRRLDGLSEQLLHKLADKRPHLLHRLRKGKEKNHVGERIRQIQDIQIPQPKILQPTAWTVTEHWCMQLLDKPHVLQQTWWKTITWHLSANACVFVALYQFSSNDKQCRDRCTLNCHCVCHTLDCLYLLLQLRSCYQDSCVSVTTCAAICTIWAQSEIPLMGNKTYCFTLHHITSHCIILYPHSHYR